MEKRLTDIRAVCQSGDFEYSAPAQNDIYNALEQVNAQVERHTQETAVRNDGESHAIYHAVKITPVLE